MKVIYTVDLDPGDCPEVRRRLQITPNCVGSYVTDAIREAMPEALHVEPHWRGYPGWTEENADEYRQPRIRRITMRIEGPKDSWTTPDA